ncbi:MAG: HEAT repeat domain-containing protein, partial [Lentisphaerae bacterium]|nr:HEAT repeat domain-containing protein [Lentisphaerota bacterium]
MKKIWLPIFLSIFATVGFSKTIGIWQDIRSHISDGMIMTMEKDGWETVILKGNDLSNEEKLAGLDVLFLPGGWNAYFYADFAARRAMVKFAAGGKGILAGAFRSGWVRTANRPLFPEVGAVYNRVNGPYVSAYGNSALAKAIDKPFCPGGWDHLVVDVGPKGEVFAVNGDDPVGVFGEVYGGRYVVFGAFIGMDAKTEPMPKTDGNALLAMLNWLASAKKLSPDAVNRYQQQAEIDFLRREMLYDWTIDSRGPDRSAGVIPSVYHKYTLPLESRLYTLRYMSDFLSDSQKQGVAPLITKLEKALADLETRYKQVITAKTTSINRMSLNELLADNPYVQGEQLTEKVEAITGQPEAATKKMLQSLKRPGVYASKELAIFLYETAIAESFMSKATFDQINAEAEKAINDTKSAVANAKRAREAEEFKKDAATLDSLIKDVVSDDVETRRTVSLELGRIGNSKASATLIKLLNDSDEQVRVNAIMALAWMQAKDAVPELIKLTKDKNIRIKSRTIQALGQIGDPVAIPVILENINNADPFVSENAIISAGWLKAKAAVPALMKIVETGSAGIGEERVKMYSAIRALGNIGDTCVVAKLEELAASTNDFPRTRASGLVDPIPNIYSTPQGLGLKRYCELALKDIADGGKKTPGVNQPSYLATKDKFFALTKNFNAFAGRAESIIMAPGFRESGLTTLPHFLQAGFTGVHNAWGSQDLNPESYFKMLKTAGELDLIWIDVLPINAFPYRAPFYKNNPQNGVEKAAADLLLDTFYDEPAFAGFWSEETYPGIKAKPSDFEAWLSERYGPGYRKTLGLKADEQLPAHSGEFSSIL